VFFFQYFFISLPILGSRRLSSTSSSCFQTCIACELAWTLRKAAAGRTFLSFLARLFSLLPSSGFHCIYFFSVYSRVSLLEGTIISLLLLLPTYCLLGGLQERERKLSRLFPLLPPFSFSLSTSPSHTLILPSSSSSLSKKLSIPQWINGGLGFFQKAVYAHRYY
jgi:hypothetical protein